MSSVMHGREDTAIQVCITGLARKDETMVRIEHTTGSVLDPTSGVTMLYLAEWERILTEALGGLLPEGVALSAVRTVLELACGPGTWVQEVAFHHPAMEVVGIDGRHAMLDFARSLTQVQFLDNASFQVMDPHLPLGFPDATFDVVTARLLSLKLPASLWRGLVQEGVRITRPGGIMCLTEMEWPTTNSPAAEQLSGLLMEAWRQRERIFRPQRRPIGAPAVLEPVLREAGLAHLHSQAVRVPYTRGERYAHPVMRMTRTAFLLLQPLLVEVGAMTADAFDGLINQMDLETTSETFRASVVSKPSGVRKSHETSEQKTCLLVSSSPTPVGGLLSSLMGAADEGLNNPGLPFLFSSFT